MAGSPAFITHPQYNAGEITGIDDITGKNNFLMSSDGKTKVKFVAEQEVPALVKVSRVAD